ncbi:MAG: hypothetical protein AB8D52_05155 [Gammaproteobacteria bacterium]
MAISKWIGGILILIAFVIAGKSQASTFKVGASLEIQEAKIETKKA